MILAKSALMFLLYKSKTRWKWWDALSWVQNYETEVRFPLGFAHWNILHLPTLQKNRVLLLKSYRSQSSHPDPKSPSAKSAFELKAEMDAEHLLWRPQITLMLIKSWSERMPETHGKVLPFWPSHHSIWKQEDWGPWGGPGREVSWPQFGSTPIYQTHS